MEADIETPHFPGLGEIYAAEAVRRKMTIEDVKQSYRDTTPIGRVIHPLEIAAAVLFLASPTAGAITGESLAVDGGITRGIYL